MVGPLDSVIYSCLIFKYHGFPRYGCFQPLAFIDEDIDNVRGTKYLMVISSFFKKFDFLSQMLNLFICICISLVSYSHMYLLLMTRLNF